MKRKIKSLSLVLSIILTSAFLSAYAAADETVSDEHVSNSVFDSYEEASDVVSEEMLAAAAARTGNEPSDWAEDQARFSVNMGIMRQTYANFYPDTVVTRAEAVYALSKIDNKTLSSVSSTDTRTSALQTYTLPLLYGRKTMGLRADTTMENLNRAQWLRVRKWR